MPKTRRKPSPHTTQTTRRRGTPNPRWAKMLAGMLHHGDRYAMLSKGERRVLAERRAAR